MCCRFPPFPPAILWPDSATPHRGRTLATALSLQLSSEARRRFHRNPVRHLGSLRFSSCASLHESLVLLFSQLGCFLASRLRSSKTCISSSLFSFLIVIPFNHWVAFSLVFLSAVELVIVIANLSVASVRAICSSPHLRRRHWTEQSLFSFDPGFLQDSMSVFKLSKPEKTRSCSSSETSSPCEMSLPFALACCFFVCGWSPPWNLLKRRRGLEHVHV